MIFSPETLLLLLFAPFTFFRSGGEGDAPGLLSTDDGEGDAAGLLSCEDGDAVSRLSKGDDWDGLGRLSVSRGDVVEPGVKVPRPFTSFS